MPTYFDYEADCAEVKRDYIRVSPDGQNLWIGVTSDCRDSTIVLTPADVQRLYDHLTTFLQEVKTEASGTGEQP